MKDLPKHDLMIEMMKNQIENGEEITTEIFLLGEDEMIYIIPTPGGPQDVIDVAIGAVRQKAMPPIMAVMIASDVWHTKDPDFLRKNPGKRISDDPNRGEMLMIAIYRRDTTPDITLYPYTRVGEDILWDPDIIEDGAFGGGLYEKSQQLISTRPLE